MRTKVFAAATLIWAVVLLARAGGADNGTVTGTVVAKGVRTSADIVVSLQAPGLTVTPPKQPITMDQKGMLFLPSVLPVVKGTAVRFLNSDPLPHNVFSPEGKYNLGTWPQGEAREFKFDKPGVYTQLCRVHPEMEAFVVVLETPYFATTDQAGRFEIKAVPPGAYTLVTWGKKLKKTEQPVTVESGKTVSVSLTLGR
jgi:plastocyanin